MDDPTASVEIAPLRSATGLWGFMISGRWPRDTVEWSKLLVLAVQVAAVPGLLSASTVFRVREERPDHLAPGSIGVVAAEGQFVGAHRLLPGQFANPQPAALLVLHPPRSTVCSVPDYDVASGCVLLPGIPHLGLDHRAAWVAADRSGTVTDLHSRSGINLSADADTAALGLLLAA